MVTRTAGADSQSFVTQLAIALSGLVLGLFDPASAVADYVAPYPDPGQGACAKNDPGPEVIRRLTHEEYRNTVKDLLGDVGDATAHFPEDIRSNGYTTAADGQTVDRLLVDAYTAAAVVIARKVVRNLGELVACPPASAGAECAFRFIDTWGKRAWRRPLTGAEQKLLRRVYTRTASSGGFAEGVRMIIQTMLQAPQFLYRIETGPAGDVIPRDAFSIRLTPWEVASRLSYLLWSTMPDQALFDAAENGGLDTTVQVEQQARRLLDDPRAHRGVDMFLHQWLGVDRAGGMEKNKDIYPSYKSEHGPLFRKELEHMVDAVIWQGDGKVATLLGSQTTYMNRELAAFYGVKGPSGDEFEAVALDPARPVGFLSRAGFLSSFAKPNQSDPVLRGKFIRERLLCQVPPPPPDDEEITLPALDNGLTTRERFELHIIEKSCRGCHRLMDPLGLAFENYDGVGLWRDKEHGRPVDPGSEIVETDFAGPISGPRELIERLAGSAQVQDCAVLQWFRFGMGRLETPDDACSLADMRRKFAAADHDVRELVVTLTGTDAFLYRRAPRR